MSASDDENSGLQIEQDLRKYSYDLTQKLTYFVISAELVFCGYMLLNTDKLKGLQNVSSLYLVTGVAALTGILWRFCYNQTYHNNAHKTSNNPCLVKFQICVYWIYVGLSLISLIWALVAGFNFIELSTKV